MNKKLDSVFHSVEECKESGHPCKMSKKNIDYIYKPDKGIKDTSIPKTLFSGKIQPKLADCVIIYNKDKLAIVEIKCGTVTKRLVNETFEKIENVFNKSGFKLINIKPMGGKAAVIYDLLNFSQTPTSFNTRILRKILKVSSPIFKILDKPNRFVTTGYFIEAKK